MKCSIAAIQQELGHMILEYACTLNMNSSYIPLKVLTKLKKINNVQLDLYITTTHGQKV